MKTSGKKSKKRNYGNFIKKNSDKNRETFAGKRSENKIKNVEDFDGKSKTFDFFRRRSNFRCKNGQGKTKKMRTDQIAHEIVMKKSVCDFFKTSQTRRKKVNVFAIFRHGICY
jgi:hypothetical protein